MIETFTGTHALLHKAIRIAQDGAQKYIEAHSDCIVTHLSVQTFQSASKEDVSGVYEYNHIITLIIDDRIEA